MKKVLTIAGSDCSGGAGIQADIKTIAVHKMYGMSVITALTAQNTTQVNGVIDTPAEFVGKQIDSIFTDIRPDAVKIGMVSNADIVNVIAERLSFYNAVNIVVDPVMIASSGNSLIKNDTVKAMTETLFPIATLITPNIPEAEILSGMKINNQEQMMESAEKICSGFNCAVLVKGGHVGLDASDFLYNFCTSKWFRSERIKNENTHGTGCTLSSAIACNLADGKTIAESIHFAKDYLSGALKQDFNLGKGSGPLNHIYNII